MSGNSIIFDERKMNKSNCYKNKKLIQIDIVDVNKMLVSKRESYGKNNQLNTLFGMMIVMTLDHYV